MAHNHQTKCSICGADLYVQELPVGEPIGSREKESAQCPVCGNVVYKGYIGGVWIVTVMEQSEKQEK